MTKFGYNPTQIKPATNNVHKLKKSFQKKIEMNVQFERPCHELKNLTSKLKILKSKFENLEKLKKLSILCLHFTLHKKWSFLLRILSVNMTKSAVSWFTEEILNGKFHFLCSVNFISVFKFWFYFVKFDFYFINLLRFYLTDFCTLIQWKHQ